VPGVLLAVPVAAWRRSGSGVGWFGRIILIRSGVALVCLVPLQLLIRAVPDWPLPADQWIREPLLESVKQ